jgi:hypothetical protein
MGTTRHPLGAAGWLWVVLAVAAMDFSLAHTVVDFGIVFGSSSYGLDVQQSLLSGLLGGPYAWRAWVFAQAVGGAKSWLVGLMVFDVLWVGGNGLTIIYCPPPCRAAHLCQHASPWQSPPGSAGDVCRLPGHATHGRSDPPAGHGRQRHRHAGLRDPDRCRAGIAGQLLSRRLTMGEGTGSRCAITEDDQFAPLGSLHALRQRPGAARSGRLGGVTLGWCSPVDPRAVPDLALHTAACPYRGCTTAGRPCRA